VHLAPDTRLRTANDRPVARDGHFVLYWQIAARRTRYNFALDHALARAAALDRPLVVLEALRCDYRWASDRLHRFVLDGMHDNAAAYARAGIAYHGYVEPSRGAGRGLLAALAAQACLVVTDEFPCFFLPHMIAAAAKQLPVRLEVIDGNGLLPLSQSPREFPTAYAFRRFLQRELAPHLAVTPTAAPLQRLRRTPFALPRAIRQRWPARSLEALRDPQTLAALPIDHTVRASAIAGGSAAASEALDEFLEARLPHYGEGRNHPDDDRASGFSPYLHFGHLSAHEVLASIAAKEDWTPARLGRRSDGKKEGWWRMSAPAEAFLDELVTWRELGYGMCTHRPNDYDRYDSLPEWARASLAKHKRDRRRYTYSLAELSEGRTHDPLWNAAQRQLLEEGRLHNYLRMVWGKKILEWSATPEAALDAMIELNNRYALDGRNPNSYSGIFWTLGRYDRPWAPERPIFGVIRYMSSENTVKKLRVKEYLRRWNG
jgi:deoxyribodipyrimidine photo-lyase